MRRQLQQLVEFHTQAGSPIRQKPTANIPQQTKEIRATLLQEELEEVLVAIKQGNLAAIAHELADLEYVLLGTVVEYGLIDVFEKVFAEVHRSNMTKFKGKTELRADGKVLKSAHYRKPDIGKILASSKK